MTASSTRTAGLGAVTPSREEFHELARGHRVIPVTRRLLADDETPVGVYRKLAGAGEERTRNGHRYRPGTFLLESAENGRSWSRWSFVGARSAAMLSAPQGGGLRWTGDVPDRLPTDGDPLDALRTVLTELHSEPLPGLPPLTGGMVGYLGYDTVRRLEHIADPDDPPVDDLRLPELGMLLATDLAALDHHEGTVTLIANAINWDATDERVDQAYDDAVTRLDRMTAELAAPAPSTVAVYLPGEPEFVRRRTPAEHHAAIEVAKEEIRAGEAFQIVVSQRFEARCDADPLEVYRVLRTTNPSPYMYLLHLEDPATGEPFAIVGSSPEALVNVYDGRATTHPIAGTRWRGATDEEDQQLEKDLRSDDKERAEHLMLVDLGRNDLGRVCEPGSVKVHNFFSVERYSHVMHLVSTVTGLLRGDRTAFDAVLACFPAGTLSGAPKVRAMQVIDRLEPTRRGLYGGIVGYLDFAGNADTAIAIRTGLIRNGTAYVQAGGGIVADSDPEAEDTETLNKARAVLSAVAAAGSLRPPEVRA
ncbi:anthranilate synthase component I [Pseudonocardia endophytica]|uniref:Anthranilate synthase component 1 n=1 Tax=Pseudonocardia endophytica TaxID=401976 RepID=A0A4R1HVF9_PSEEN|nr:anthranilate synthase component I [Pseudonocardia endophytica]TCK24975.1 anthranilate synthase component 1 [Pseudonocardia endophytica]